MVRRFLWSCRATTSVAAAHPLPASSATGDYLPRPTVQSMVGAVSTTWRWLSFGGAGSGVRQQHQHAKAQVSTASATTRPTTTLRAPVAVQEAYRRFARMAGLRQSVAEVAASAAGAAQRRATTASTGATPSPPGAEGEPAPAQPQTSANEDLATAAASSSAPAQGATSTTDAATHHSDSVTSDGSSVRQQTQAEGSDAEDVMERARAVGATVANAAAAALPEGARVHRDEIVTIAACVVLLALFVYWTRATIRRTERLCDAARADAQERLRGMEADLERLKSRWSADIAQRDAALSKVLDDNAALTTNIDRLTGLLKRCDR